jgi:hypothetical protein
MCGDEQCERLKGFICAGALFEASRYSSWTQSLVHYSPDWTLIHSKGEKTKHDEHRHSFFVIMAKQSHLSTKRVRLSLQRNNQNNEPKKSLCFSILEQSYSR